MLMLPIVCVYPPGAFPLFLFYCTQIPTCLLHHFSYSFFLDDPRPFLPLSPSPSLSFLFSLFFFSFSVALAAYLFIF
ncbi:hypothetical protein BC940DRAFT_127894 [Gongronella butleri]|nr:hypothetical protein BC940DRAFT_127894 [Gongronella butleri]